MQKGVQETLVSTDILRFVLWVGSVLHPPNSKHILFMAWSCTVGAMNVHCTRPFTTIDASELPAVTKKTSRGVGMLDLWAIPKVLPVRSCSTPYHPCMVYLPTFGWFLWYHAFAHVFNKDEYLKKIGRAETITATVSSSIRRSTFRKSMQPVFQGLKRKSEFNSPGKASTFNSGWNSSLHRMR